jgi:hypothetical protein
MHQERKEKHLHPEALQTAPTGCYNTRPSPELKPLHMMPSILFLQQGDKPLQPEDTKLCTCRVLKQKKKGEQRKILQPLQMVRIISAFLHSTLANLSQDIKGKNQQSL